MSSSRFKPLVIAALVPVVYAAQLLLPEGASYGLGLGDALACSGGSSGVAAPRESGWTWLKPSLGYNPGSPPAPVPVATDGFFVIDAEGSMLSAETAGSSMQLVVTDGSGATIAGQTKLLLNKQDGWYLFGWSSSSPLAVGTQLRASLSAAPVVSTAAGNVGGEFALVVVGAPTPLPQPSFTFSSWTDYYVGEGPFLTCSSSPTTTCGVVATTIDVPATLTKRAMAEVTWQVPQVAEGVAWTVRLEASKAQPDANPQFTPPYEYLGSLSDSALTLGSILFQTSAPSYCATLVLTDLRTGQEKRSETCSAPQPALSVQTDTRLAACDAPPSQTLRDVWCRLQPDPTTEPACAPNAGNVGGSGGSSAGTGDGDVLGGKPGAKPPAIGGSGTMTNGADDADDLVSPRTSKGCQLGVSAPSPSTSVTWSLLALALLARRRSQPS